MKTHSGKKIFYVTDSNLDYFGAPRTIDSQMVQNFQDLGFSVIWFGINLHSVSEVDVTKVSYQINYFQSFFRRIVNKVLRVCKIESGEQQKLRVQVEFDIWLSKKLLSMSHYIDKNVFFIGRAVSSAEAFKVVKRFGGMCILHSQWTHPLDHKEILNKIFDQVGSSYVPIPDERIVRQLTEIDLCDYVWCVSSQVYNAYLSRGVDKKKLALCPLGVDLNKFNSSSNAAFTGSTKVTLLFVGNINFEKGVHILFDALMQLNVSNIRLILHGAVPEYFRPTFQRYLPKLKDKGFEVVLNHGDSLNSYLQSDIFVLPSLQESFGLVVLEAMAMGMPVVVSDCVGAAEHVIDSRNGFIVPAGTSDDLAYKISLLVSDARLRKEFGARSSELAQSLGWLDVAKSVSSKLLKG